MIFDNEYLCEPFKASDDYKLFFDMWYRYHKFYPAPPPAKPYDLPNKELDKVWQKAKIDAVRQVETEAVGDDRFRN